MGFLDRLKMGLVLTKDSVLVIRHNPRLALFPLASGVTGIVFLALFLGVTFGLAQVAPDAGILAALFLAYLALTFLSSFFAAGLVHQTREVLAGGNSSLEAGLRAAWGRKRPLFIWSIIAATIGVIINGLENADSRVARIFGVLFSVAWSLMTFFVIPVIVFERTSTVEMFKESARKFKQTYGETPVSLVGIQLISLVFALPVFLLGLLFFMLDLVVITVALLLIGAALSFMVSQTLSGVVKTALYFYAEEGTKPDEFDNIDFNSLGAKQDSGGGTAIKTTPGGFH